MNKATAAAPDQIVDRLLRAIETVDDHAPDAIYADNATVWQNFTNVAQHKADNIALLLRVSLTGSLQYELTESHTAGERVFRHHVLTIRAGLTDPHRDVRYDVRRPDYRDFQMC